MGSSISQFASETQSVTNNILQQSTEKCINSCTNNRDNLFIDLTNTDISGSINADQFCTISGVSCSLKSGLDSTLDNTLQATAKQTQVAETDLFSIDFGSYDQDVEINQQIRNNISQIMNAACGTPVTNIDVNPTIIATNTKVNGSVSITQNGSITNTKCFLNNVAASTIKNTEIAKIEQFIAKGSIFMWIIIAVALIVVMVVAGAVIILITKSGGKAFEAYENNKRSTNLS